MPPLTPLLDANVVAALADAAQRTGMPTSQLQVQSAESVIWRDGSLGCSQPGLAHTQALVPGLRVRIRAGDAVLDYHAGRNGLVSFCPTGRAEEPLPDDARS